ncbi:MAG TPA: IS21 family transposase [Candidatus Paceibacterota bacterium]|nr:IS21 family transposase [Candidatus Paceibacterota bacterium]
MVTDKQVRLLMSLIKQGLPLAVAAAKSGMSERTARKYRRSGSVPSQIKRAHDWRTRPDPFEAVWSEVQALLERDSGLQAKAVFEELCARYPQRFEPGQLRTLQRRFRAWRAHAGEAREVFFPQIHVPGEQGQSDFTDMRKLQITVAGEPFAHLLYHFVLTYSNWESVSICFSESFEALSEGLQRALWQLGGVPREHRTDNLSAATHELQGSRGRDFTARYRELLDHYGLKASRNYPGNAHENGDVESSHASLKNAIDQRLRLRGSRAFDCREHYGEFVQEVIEARNATRITRLTEERAQLRALPVRALPAYQEVYVTVSRASVVRVARKSYSVPSRLIGHRLLARVHAAMIELAYQGEALMQFERLVGATAARIDYRHIIHALVRKPGAFRRYAFREALFPQLVFRHTYDRLLETHPSRADLDYVRILHLAATEGEAKVTAVLEQLLSQSIVPEYEAVRGGLRCAAGAAIPALSVPQPDLNAYDQLLSDNLLQEVAA